jgi:hypothetical protein
MKQPINDALRAASEEVNSWPEWKRRMAKEGFPVDRGDIKRRRDELNKEREELKRKRELEDMEMRHKWERLKAECKHPSVYNYNDRTGYTCRYCPDCGMDS